MTSTATVAAASIGLGSAVLSTEAPPLENGDRLTLREFMRRYESLPEDKKTELIEGIVFMGAATRHVQRGRPHGWLSSVIATYAMRAGLDFGDNSTVELDEDNAPQPDLLMFLPTEMGGRTRINEDGYLEGPPDFIAEISASTVSLDLHGKFRAYQKMACENMWCGACWTALSIGLFLMASSLCL